MAQQDKGKYDGVSENKFVKINKTWKSFSCKNGTFLNCMAVSDSYKDEQGKWNYTNQYTIKWFSNTQYMIGTSLQIAKITRAVVETSKSNDNKLYTNFVIYVEMNEGYQQQQYQGYQGYQQPQYQGYQQPQYQGYQGQQPYMPPQQNAYQGYQEQQYQAQYQEPYYNDSDDDLNY